MQLCKVLYFNCWTFFLIIVPLCLSQHNETHQDWKIQAKVCGEGFSGPEVVNVPAGTKVCYPLTFQPSAQCIVMVMPFFFFCYRFILSFFSCMLSVFIVCPPSFLLSHPCSLTLLVICFLADHDIFAVQWPRVCVYLR